MQSVPNKRLQKSGGEIGYPHALKASQSSQRSQRSQRPHRFERLNLPATHKRGHIIHQRHLNSNTDHSTSWSLKRKRNNRFSFLFFSFLFLSFPSYREKLNQGKVIQIAINPENKEESCISPVSGQND